MMSTPKVVWVVRVYSPANNPCVWNEFVSASNEGEAHTLVQESLKTRGFCAFRFLATWIAREGDE